MGWKQALFKGKKVWAQVLDDGEIDPSDGLVGIRYSNRDGATIYRASVRNVVLQSGPVEQLPSGSSSSSSARTQRSSGYGSAGTRTEQQKKNAQVDIRTFLNGLPESTVRCFTDGSCQGNPGPSGTGVYIQIGDREIKHFRYLGGY